MTQLTQSPCFKSAGVASSAALPGRTARYKYDAPFRACSTGMIASPSEVMTSRWLVCVCNIATCPTWSIVRSSSRNGTAEAAQSCVIASSVTKHDLPIAPMRDILLRNRTGEYSCREQACRNLTDLDTMLRAAFACHIVQKPASRTCAAVGFLQQRNVPQPDLDNCRKPHLRVGRFSSNCLRHPQFVNARRHQRTNFLEGRLSSISGWPTICSGHVLEAPESEFFQDQ